MPTWQEQNFFESVNLDSSDEIICFSFPGIFSAREKERERAKSFEIAEECPDTAA